LRQSRFTAVRDQPLALGWVRSKRVRRLGGAAVTLVASRWMTSCVIRPCWEPPSCKLRSVRWSLGCWWAQTRTLAIVTKRRRCTALRGRQRARGGGGGPGAPGGGHGCEERPWRNAPPVKRPTRSPSGGAGVEEVRTRRTHAAAGGCAERKHAGLDAGDAGDTGDTGDTGDHVRRVRRHQLRRRSLQKVRALFAVRYCSKLCQHTHWPVHKASCAERKTPASHKKFAK
jgi:hypothetical protein